MLQKKITSYLYKCFLALVLLALGSGCTTIIVNPLLDPLSLSLQKQTDLELLQDGAPTLLLLLDGLIAGDPDNERLLMATIKAYGAYASILYEEGQIERAVNMSLKSKEYGINLLKQLPTLENLDNLTLEESQQALAGLSAKKVEYLFWGAYGWATWIQYQDGAPASMADLPIVEQIMLRVVELDESYYYGGAHIFLGAYYGSRPQMYGGKPDLSRQHFERALTINKRAFLLTQVAYAQTYARLMFDRELYLKLLAEVIEQPLADSDMASSNKLAKIKAEKLISQVDEFF
ncbi:TRAP transporter TatT component family protein [Thermodesulfobacteriota bacterium]